MINGYVVSVELSNVSQEECYLEGLPSFTNIESQGGESSSIIAQEWNGVSGPPPTDQIVLAPDGATIAFATFETVNPSNGVCSNPGMLAITLPGEKSNMAIPNGMDTTSDDGYLVCSSTQILTDPIMSSDTLPTAVPPGAQKAAGVRANGPCTNLRATWQGAIRGIDDGQEDVWRITNRASSACETNAAIPIATAGNRRLTALPANGLFSVSYPFTAAFRFSPIVPELDIEPGQTVKLGIVYQSISRGCQHKIEADLLPDWVYCRSPAHASRRTFDLRYRCTNVLKSHYHRAVVWKNSAR